MVEVALFELDPDVRPDRRDGEDAHLAACVGGARQRPPRGLASEEAGDCDLDAPLRRRVHVVGDNSPILPVVLPPALAQGGSTCDSDPSPSRVIVKLWVYSPSLMLCVTLCT